MALQTRLTALAAAIANYIRDNVNPRLLPTGGAKGQIPVKAASGFAWSTLAHPALVAALEAASRAYLNSPRVVSPDPAPVIVGGTLPGVFTRASSLQADGHPFAVYGGEIVNDGTSTTFPAVTTSAGVRTGVVWRVAMQLEGDEIVLRLDGGTPTYRLLVDGRYVSMDALFAATGSDSYYRITFPTRKMREIAIEGDRNARFFSAHVKEDSLILPPTRSGLRVVIVGDSNIAASGQAFLGDGFVRVAGDQMGVPDTWASGVYGTGFVATNLGANLTYGARRADWLGPNVKPDILVLTGSVNDVFEGASPAAVKAAAIVELTQARAAYPTLPIVVTGIAGSREYFTSIGALSVIEAMETALKEAAESMADPLIAFTPIITDVPFLTGTSEANGNWAYSSLPDGHASTAGHATIGAYVSRRLLETFARMAGVKAPAPMPSAAAPFDPARLPPAGGAVGSVLRRTSSTAAEWTAPVVDRRKLAKWFAGGLDGKVAIHVGDSTTWQQDPISILKIDGSQGLLQDWHVSLRATTHWNVGSNGNVFWSFVQSGGLEEQAARKADLYIICYGLNDMRGAVSPGGEWGDWRVPYGDASMVVTALKLQSLMRTCVEVIKAENPDACIIFRMPNGATVDCAYMTQGITPQQMMDVLRLAYRGDAALGVPSPETFGDDILVFDTMGMAFPEKAMVSQNMLLQNNAGSDGLHPTNNGYTQIMWPLGLLMSGPPADIITSPEHARQLAAREKAIASGWASEKLSVEAVLYSGEWFPVYTCGIALNDFGIVDLGFGPTADAGRNASGSDDAGNVQNNHPAGLSFDDVIVWGTGENASLMSCKNIGNWFLLDSTIRFSGAFIDGVSVPTTMTGSGVIYRHRYAHSTAVRKNAIALASETPIERNNAYPTAIRFCVVGATVGTLTVRAIRNETDTGTGNDVTQHEWSASDRLCLAGVEAAQQWDLGGLPLTGATFSKSGFEVTITLPGIDFTSRLGDQGFVLSNTVVSPGDFATLADVEASATASRIVTFSADYPVTAADKGATLYHPTTDATARTVTLPSNGVIPIPVGTVITVDNEVGAGAVTIAITTDTLTLVGDGSTGPRTLAAGGRAVVQKVTATRWRISGVGLT